MSRHFGGSGPAGQADKTKLILLLILFFLLALSIFVVFFLLSSSDKAAKQEAVSAPVAQEEIQIKTTDVLVPVKEIPAGSELSPDMFKIESRPLVGISGRAVKNFEAIQGYFAKSLILPGQPLYMDYISAERPVNTLTAAIPEGYRAVTIQVDQRSSVEGWARPGARVDVVWASSIRGQPGVTIIVENAKVLSAERDTKTESEPGKPVPSTVTLLVTAKDAAKIQLASTTGSMSLSLRGDIDSAGGVATGSITVDDLYGSTQKNKEEAYDGKVIIDGQEWYLKKGELIPAAKVKANQAEKE
ncbi:MAG: Flp pilus assembly protein CpaB [Bdellovibrionales bacterium]|nr:Flp pilus assembly protein CpaB [Bdellovibrionales bacterium]